MASRKRSSSGTAAAAASSSSTCSSDNPRLELAKAIHALTQKMDGFDKAAEALTSFTKDTLVEFDLQIEAKNEELARLSEENEHTQKRLRTETSLFLAEHRYEGAKKILAERNEVAVLIADYDALKANLARITAEREKELETAIKTEKERGRAALEAAVQIRELNHKAQTAELTATTNQQIKEIESLKRTIDNLKDEVAQQRKLTEAVANAGRSAPITLQTNGK